jgi:hypothetical protein
VTVADENERFLSRWSRLKHEHRAEPAAPVAEAKPAEKPVPPVESVTPESDFSPFMQPKVKEELRRVALKKLFSDPHFNVPDPFEPYSRDWNIADPIPPDLLAKLNQARTVLLTPEERKALEEKEQAEAAKAEEAAREKTVAKETKADEPGSENT